MLSSFPELLVLLRRAVNITQEEAKVTFALPLSPTSPGKEDGNYKSRRHNCNKNDTSLANRSKILPSMCIVISPLVVNAEASIKMRIGCIVATTYCSGSR